MVLIAIVMGVYKPTNITGGAHIASSLDGLYLPSYNMVMFKCNKLPDIYKPFPNGWCHITFHGKIWKKNKIGWMI